jgi:hypothetical protein
MWIKRLPDKSDGRKHRSRRQKVVEKIKLQKVISDRHDSYFLKTESEANRQKELSMNKCFQEGFEKGMKAIATSLEKKSGIKTEEKVYERVGRISFGKRIL